MILHRLRLTDFRGVADREITFPEQGVVVICGPNEIGKSSMFEALDLLLAFRDRSTHRDVKAVKPSHADVGAYVEAEISIGTYRFVYRKRFHKKAMTELDVLAPKREQLSGDDAHQRVEAILAETLDTKLWTAQRVLQSASTSAVNLSGSDALARALDAAGGNVGGGGSGDESLLVDRIDAEYLKYFTGTGRPTGVWRSAIERVKSAQEQVDRCLLAVGEVEAQVSRHQELTVAVRALTEALGPATERLTAATAAHNRVDELAAQVAQARLAAEAAEAKNAKSTQDSTLRHQLVADAQRRDKALTGLRTTLADAEEQQAAAAAAAEIATAAAEKVAAVAEAAQERFDTARAVAKACIDREAAEVLSARVADIDGIEQELDRIAGELAGIAITPEVLAEIEAQSMAVQRIEAQLQADVGTVEFTAPADLDITVDGQTHTLRAGECWTRPASAAVVVDVPEILTIRIAPSASAVTLRTEHAAAQRLLLQKLAAVRVVDLDAARALDARRRALTDGLATFSARLEGLCAGTDAASMRGQLAELRAAGCGAGQADAGAAAAELAEADESLRTVRADVCIRQRAATDTAAALAAAGAAATVARDRLKSGEEEAASVHEQLAALRAVASDEALAAQASAAAAALCQANDALTALVERHSAADPAGVQAEFASAAEAVESIAARRDAAAMDLHTVSVELSVIGCEGRQGRLDEAQTELERACCGHSRVRERAVAAQLLRDTMIRHRDNTRQRYVQPYRDELERLGRQVFGSNLEVDVDTELTIQTRTLDGCTVPYESLSGGAKEQLGILARLAGAALVAEEDTVPVVIDDALGFSDPDRLIKMGSVLGSVGDRGQVIVLTCTPGRYDSVADAEIIELTA